MDLKNSKSDDNVDF